MQIRWQYTKNYSRGESRKQPVPFLSRRGPKGNARLLPAPRCRRPPLAAARQQPARHVGAHRDFQCFRLRASIKERQEVFHLCPRLLLCGPLRVPPPSVHLPPARAHVHCALQQKGRPASRAGC
ncbi:NudC domain containing 1 [Phyllostomus discolor]|uniref:NudC domain containing 1 n=1 Tax=Phyllostomus discolor TaxID=89673 RepID=A0A833ZWQ4_9CHIR|nr:NudC domain containing 1 [Phyllostomus discolor]